MSQGRDPGSFRYTKCKICGKVCLKGMGILSHSRSHKRKADKEQTKFI